MLTVPTNGSKANKDDTAGNGSNLTIFEAAAESQISEDIRSVKLDLPNQGVVRADTERARFIKKE